jgi:shikimate kinase
MLTNQEIWQRVSPLNKSNIVLIGFMGSGKTSVSKALAQKTQFPLVDTDQTIEAMEEKSITQIFSLKGEDYFRKLEEALCEQLLNRQNSVISTGGGLILSPKNQELLKKMGVIVYLDASVETIANRIKNETSRPLLNTQKNPLSTLSILLKKRQPIYEKLADFKIKTDQKSVTEIAEEIWKFYSKTPH